MERKEKSQGEIRVFSLSSWKDGTVIYFDREKWFEGRVRELSFGHGN